MTSRDFAVLHIEYDEVKTQFGHDLDAREAGKPGPCPDDAATLQSGLQGRWSVHEFYWIEPLAKNLSIK
jgi:hypothetical protein